MHDTRKRRHPLADLLDRYQAATPLTRLPDPSVRKALREAAGVSQVQAAAVVGLAPASLWNIERGTRSPHQGTEARYLKLLSALMTLAVASADEAA